MNYNTLYPVVHDLTEADSYGCCSMTYAPPGCFSLKDLVNPNYSAMPFNSDEEEAYQTPRRSTPFRARQRSEYPAYTTPLHQLRSLVDDDRNDDASVVEEPKVRFEQVYVLTRQVNKGRLSNVWECIHKTSGLRFAAKIVNKRNLSPKDEDLIYQEVSTLSQIRDGPSSLSGLIEFFDEDTRFYIILDFAEGGDLLTTLVQKQKLNEMEAKLLAKSLLDGLVHLHERKICHRNIKPENLVLKDAQDMSTVVIIDFGMAARVLQDADGDPLNLTERCGTAMFMAPEVIAQIPYDTQADMWSFGVLMFYVLTGVHPYEDTERHALYLKICKNEYSFHPMEWQGISKTAKRFVANLLHTDPEVRMTAEECLAHSWLAEFLPPPPPPLPPPELLSSPSKSEPQVNKRARSSKLKGVWRVMTKRKGSVDELENMDDWKSTSSKTTSLLSSNVTGGSDRHSSSR